MKLGKDLLHRFGTLFSSSTILKWHLLLVACKHDAIDLDDLAARKRTSKGS